MARLSLDHITIHCRDLERSRRFYIEILGLEDGYRPPFDGPPGAWLYENDVPVVHLYAGRDGNSPNHPPLDHIAFVSDDLPAVKRRLDAKGIEYGTATVPELGAEQVFFEDPDGIRLEISNASAADLIRDRAK